MGNFLDQIRARIAAAKGDHSIDGKTLTGQEPTEVEINPEIDMKAEQVDFSTFLELKEASRLGMVGSIGGERKGLRHLKNYVAPYLSDEQRQKTGEAFSQHLKPGTFKAGHGEKYNPDETASTHTLAYAANGHEAGTPVRVIGARHEPDGSIFVQTAKHGEVQMSKLAVPGEVKRQNMTQGGFDIESRIAKNLGGQAAGSTGSAYDFSYRGDEGGIRGKARKTEDDKPVLRGESKQNRAKMGESALKLNKQTGKWEFSNEKLREHFSRAVHPESGLSILDHLNKHHSDGKITKGFSVNAPAGMARGYLASTGANSLHLHNTNKSKGIDNGTTYTIGNDNPLAHKTNLGHLNDDDIDQLDGKLSVEATTTGATKIAHKPNFQTFRKYALASREDPNTHVDLSREDHAAVFKKNIDHHLGKPQQTNEEVENEGRHVTFFGRVNPPHIGHEAASSKVLEVANKEGATHTMVLSRSHDPKKNPLSPEQKLKHTAAAFPDNNVELARENGPTILDHLSDLHKNGVKHVTIVAGSDRIQEYEKLVHAYNGVGGKRHGFYHFKTINFASAGERDPDAEGGVGAASASNQRRFAMNNDFENFSRNAPSRMKPAAVKAMFKDVQKGMALKEGAEPCEKCGRVNCRVH